MLYILTPIFCVALLCGAVFSFLNNSKAFAAIAPNDTAAKTKVVWTGTGNYQYYSENVNNSGWGEPVPYSGNPSLTTPGTIDTTKGDCGFDDDTATATASKLNLGLKQQVANFVTFKATITIPAYTEYKVLYKGALNIKEYGTYAGVAILYAFGNTYVPNSFVFPYVNSNTSVTGEVVTCQTSDKVMSNKGVAANKNSDKFYTVTYTNTTGMPEEKTEYFGVYTVDIPSKQSNHYYEASVTMSSDITVTQIETPEVDTTPSNYPDTYTGNDLTFTLNNLDANRIVLTKYSYKDRLGNAEEKYTYGNTATSTATGTDPLNGGNTLTVTEAGTYTLEFDIAYNCGSVWNTSTKNDQATKKVEITVKPKQITKPTAPTTTEKDYTGSGVEFEFVSSYKNDEWNKYIKLDSATDTSGNAVTGVTDKQNKKIEITNPGTYVVKLGLASKNNTVWADTPLVLGGTANFNLKIKTGTISAPTLGNTANHSYDGKAKEITVTGFDYRYMDMTVEGKNGTAAVSTVPTVAYDTYKYWVKSDGTTTETDPQDPVNYTEEEGRKNYKIKATSAGNYKVTFKLNAEGKKLFLWNDGSADGTAVDQEATFSIAKQSVVVPTPASTLALTYNTQAQTMQIRNATNNTFESTLYTASISGKQFAADGTASNTAVATAPTITGGLASVTDAGIYTVKVVLSNKTDCVWASGTNDDVADKEITITVNRAELEASFTCSAKNFSWQKKKSDETAESITATVTGVLNGQTVTFTYYWKKNGANEQDNDISSGANLTASVDIPTTLGTWAAGYTFGVKLGTDGANYVFKSGKDSKGFTITATEAGLDEYVWKYTLNDGTQINMPANKELAYTLVKDDDGTVSTGIYNIILDDSDFSDYYIEIDKTKFTGGYKTEFNGGTVTSFKDVGTYKTYVALKTTDSEYQFIIKNQDGTETKSSTMTLELEWSIVKGTFDLSGVKWEYTYTDSNGQKQTKDYTGALEFDDINYAVRIKESTLPAGLALDSAYQYSGRERAVNTYTVTASKSDFSWNQNFNDPDMTVSTLTLNWEIKQKNLYTKFKYEKVTGTKSDGTVVSFYNKVLDVEEKYKSFVKYEYTDSNGTVVTLQEIIDAVDMTSPKKYSVRAYIDSAATNAANFELLDNGSDPTDSITTGSNNAPVYVVIDGVMIDGVNAATISAVYDGQAHFNKLEVVSGSGVKISDFTVTFYKGASLSAEKFADGEYPVNAGEYTLEVVLGSSAEEDYILLLDVIKVTIEKKEIAVPTVGNILFSGEYISLADYLGGSYAEYKDIIALSGDCRDIRNVSQSGYKARLTLTDPNYKWAQPTTAEPASLKLFAAKLFDNELAIVDDVTAEIGWNITPLVLDVSEMWVKGKSGATLNLPENIAKLIDAETLSVLYRYYDDADQYIETPELKGGKSFRVEAAFGGIDAESGNVLFKTADGNVSAVSDKISYTVPQSATAAFFGSAVGFLKANWLWFVIGAAVLLFLIILICLIASAKKKKRKKEELEEQRRLEKEEREREERKLEREERMARLSQVQAAPAPQYIPQPMPQYAPQPQYMPQSMPQNAQPTGMGGAMGGGSITEAMFMQMQAEFAAMKAEQAAKELAEIKAEQAAIKAEQNAMRNDFVLEKSGAKAQAAGISVDAMTEIMTMALKNVLASATQQVVAAQPQQPAQLTDGGAPAATANAPTQIPPDAVMTTVTTTKIDTTKKPAQPGERAAQAAPVRTVVRNYVAPMPVDDGRVFDVGGFYKPADPVTDMDFGEEEKKD
ncbi:MAG: hypothetical protein K2I17_02465 [Clostridia bacterium]|nr:hypothetical protein [Clostridia bacterium]